MKLKTLLILHAIIPGIFGLFLLLLPQQSGLIYGFPASQELEFMARFLGVYLLMEGILSWMIRNEPASLTRTAVLYAFLTSGVLGFLVALIYQLNGTVSAAGWSTVVLFLFFGLGFAYFLFVKPASE